MRRLLIALFLALIRQNVAVAEDVVRFDPATGAYQGCSSIGDSRVWFPLCRAGLWGGTARGG